MCASKGRRVRYLYINKPGNWKSPSFRTHTLLHLQIAMLIWNALWIRKKRLSKNICSIFRAFKSLRFFEHTTGRWTFAFYWSKTKNRHPAARFRQNKGGLTTEGRDESTSIDCFQTQVVKPIEEGITNLSNNSRFQHTSFRRPNTSQQCLSRGFFLPECLFLLSHEIAPWCIWTTLCQQMVFWNYFMNQYKNYIVLLTCIHRFYHVIHSFIHPIPSSDIWWWTLPNLFC